MYQIKNNPPAKTYRRNEGANVNNNKSLLQLADFVVNGIMLNSVNLKTTFAIFVEKRATKNRAAGLKPTSKDLLVNSQGECGETSQLCRTENKSSSSSSLSTSSVRYSLKRNHHIKIDMGDEWKAHLVRTIALCN